MEILDIILLAVIIMQYTLHYFERRDMYNRLMSRDLRDYKQGTSQKPPEKHIPSAHERVLKNWRDTGR
jgi:hypothetical protein